GRPLRVPRPGGDEGPWVVAGSGSVLLNSLRSNLDPDRIGHKPATGFQSHVPGQSPVFAIDRGLRFESQDLLPHRTLPPACEFGVQHYFARDSSNRQVSDYLSMIITLWLDACALERDRREVLNIQEVR